ncbi:hypothetical protein [Nocardia sp. NPDC051832]|uniref:hypothetical protein n=1 Tax=Nocardia sp. NPDC051832 TaxID=3155673 RepID=UPI00341D6CCC
MTTWRTATEDLLRDLVGRYGSVESMFVALDSLRADPEATTAELCALPSCPAQSGRHHRVD